MPDSPAEPSPAAPGITLHRVLLPAEFNWAPLREAPPEIQVAVSLGTGVPQSQFSERDTWWITAWQGDSAQYRVRVAKRPLFFGTFRYTRPQNT